MKNTFKYNVNAHVFEKANAPEGQEKHIGGIISTEREDLQGEKILVDGLDLSPFLTRGFFNDNHDRSTSAIIGYPKATKVFQKGERLPDNTKAPEKGVWVEGYLLNTPKAKEIWEIGKALEGSNRGLSFSVEGKVLERGGPKTIEIKKEDGEKEYVGKLVTKAEVRAVAITAVPVNTDSHLSLLEKSLIHMSQTEEGNNEKSLTDSEAIYYIKGRIPNITLEAAQRLVSVTRKLKSQGQI